MSEEYVVCSMRASTPLYPLVHPEHYREPGLCPILQSQQLSVRLAQQKAPLSNFTGALALFSQEGGAELASALSIRGLLTG
jgi:hypothetical protein